MIFKVRADNDAERNQVMWSWNELAVYPYILRQGNYMTVDHWSGEWLAFADGNVELDGTVKNLMDAGDILKQAENLSE